MLALGIELWVRFVIRPPSIGLQRSYEAYFESGDLYPVDASRVSAFAGIAGGREGPASKGYQLARLVPGLASTYFYEPSASTLSPLGRTDFLFQTYLSRHTPEFVDAPKAPGHLRVFVLGSSVAVGSSASSPQTTWHALLEKRLRQKTGADIDVISAAMGAFVSTQERLAFDLAVLPRQPDVVIVLDGPSDVVTALAGIRPGDPYMMGSRYAQQYHPGGAWLESNSAAWRWLTSSRASAASVRRAARLLGDEQAKTNLVDGVAAAYRENVSHIVQVSRALGIESIVFLEPIRVVIDPVERRPAAEAPLGQPYIDLWVRAFDGIRHSLAPTPYADALVDLSRAMVGENLFAADGVHLTDRGHEILAAAIYPRVERAVMARLATQRAIRPTGGHPVAPSATTNAGERPR